MDDILKLIKEKEKQDYYTRMDEHKSLYALEQYQMKINNRIIPDVINITLNDPQTYADYIISSLVNSVQQIEVEGDKLLSGQAEKIEEFIDAVMQVADERLTNMEYPGLNEFDFSMACLRGRVARRNLLRMYKGKFIADILPIDTRWFTYDVNEEGMNWGCCQFWKSRDQIKSMYPSFKDAKDLGDTEEYEVRDFWNDKQHCIFIAEAQVLEEANPYGYVPFVVQVCNTGNNLLDKDMRKYKGNSVYSGIAELYPELNRVVSILATLNVRTIEGAMQYKSAAGTQAELPDDPPQGLRKVFPVEKDGGYFAMPIEDIKEATQMLWNILEQRKQEATIASTKYGNLEFPLSAVALAKLGSETDKVLLPRIEAVAQLNMKSARMMIDQLKKIGGTIEVGEVGSFDTSVLDGKYTIKYNYTQSSPQQDVANISIANSAKEFLSTDTIIRDILKVQDPNAEFKKQRIAKFEAIGADNMSDSELYQVIHDLRDEGRNVEAEMALQSLEQRLKNKNMPQPTNAPVTSQKPSPTGQTNSGENILPLTDERGTRAKVKAEKLTE